MAGLAATGTTLSIGGTTIVQVENISGPSISATAIDVSAHDSASDWREFVPGMKDGGEITFDVNWDHSKSSHYSTGILGSNVGAGIAATASACIITWAGTAQHTVDFDGFITGVSWNSPLDDKQTASVTIKCTGIPAFGTVV